ncbi:hypothetical protein BCV08_15820 [Vibrio breoganii]|uniref:hypothetical protein n=1 Tax=Vibrio breoganii TaxID=553239 RepID=UPI000C860B7F|nr:hypothetical protein [Vibrio breoganii]PMF80618.1 hypothetical protein BCV08_15820 [Vibrio breoganii]
MIRNWIKTDPARIVNKDASNKPTVHVQFITSPYDVPEAVRAYIDELTDKLIIEFKYIPIKEKTKKQQDGSSTFDVGKNTGRIYKIELDKPTATQILIETRTEHLSESSFDNVENAIDSFIKHNESMNKHTLKYKAAQSALQEYKIQLATA